MFGRRLEAIRIPYVNARRQQLRENLLERHAVLRTHGLQAFEKSGGESLVGGVYLVVQALLHAVEEVGLVVDRRGAGDDCAGGGDVGDVEREGQLVRRGVSLLDGSRNRGIVGIGPIGRRGHSLDLNGIGSRLQIGEGHRSGGGALLGFGSEYIAVTGCIFYSLPADGESVTELLRDVQNRGGQFRARSVVVLVLVAGRQCKGQQARAKKSEEFVLHGVEICGGTCSFSAILPGISTAPKSFRGGPAKRSTYLVLFTNFSKMPVVDEQI